MSRLATLSQGGKTLTYSRLTNSDRLDKAEFSPASAAPAVEYSYDTKLRLVSKGCGTRSFTDKDEVWYFDCPAGTPGNWGTSRYYSYDSMGQLTLAGEGALGPDGQVDNPQNFSYDSIGNHLTNNETYSILNQGSGKTYDANGNMTANGSDWRAWYDGENRLRTVSHPYDGVELLYDYAGRIYQVNDFYMDEDVQETPTLNYRRIYDGTKLIATVRNGEIEDTFVWQPETSGDADVILWDNSYVYATDPNKNVRVKRFPNDWIPGTWVEEFIDYKPFGELKNYVANPPRFMFSSEEYMSETGMYHYLYRAYSPSLARFITRDPIEEAGGVNLYCFVNNNPVSYWDRWGLNWGDLWASIRNPFSAWDAKAAADIANELSYKYAIETNNVVGYHNGPADALRHCIWNCEMTRTIGAEKAKVFGDSHEINPPSARETQMDLHNNKVGRELGASEQCEDKEKNCADLCKEALDNGKLVQFEYDISEKYYTNKTNIIPTGSHLTTMQQYQPTDPGEYKQSYPYSTTDYGIINGMYNAVN